MDNKIQLISEENFLKSNSELKYLANTSVLIFFNVINNYTTSVLTKLIENGCLFYSFSGLNSEKIHDFLDDLLEEKNISAITTWHSDQNLEDIVDYNAVLPQYTSVTEYLIIHQKDSCTCAHEVFNELRGLP
jgi:hypothetical protein